MMASFMSGPLLSRAVCTQVWNSLIWPSTESVGIPFSFWKSLSFSLSVFNTPTGNPSGNERSSQELKLWGVTSDVQARKLGMYKYAVTKHRSMIHSFSTDFEYLMCTKGDRIKYAGDIALAGITQGRISSVITEDDSVIGFVTADVIFKLHPEMDQGLMSKLRSFLVCSKSLANYSRKYNIHEFIRIGHSITREQLSKSDKILEDVFEAFIGAIYLDQGIEIAYRIIKDIFYDDILNFDIDDIVVEKMYALHKPSCNPKM